ncbi:hypothetical protein Tco_0707125 [Tanacetum coccineum]|uniref:Uncharacterized protein n=1 Tax=Tanacetum coccineum TaxID=301880 RepID=A0ABQ4Y9B6_9ASTR
MIEFPDLMGKRKLDEREMKGSIVTVGFLDSGGGGQKKKKNKNDRALGDACLDHPSKVNNGTNFGSINTVGTSTFDPSGTPNATNALVISVGNERATNEISSSYGNKLKPTSVTKANLRILDATVPNDADDDVWLPLASVYEILDGKLVLGDDDEKPLDKVDYPVNLDSDDEVEPVDNETANFLA